MNPPSPPGSIANFDSASGMLRALGNDLRGEDFPVLGMKSHATEPLMRAYGAAVNALPDPLRKQVYIWSGWGEAVPPGALGSVRAEEIARWAVGQYPRRRYPAAMVGSSNGALVHLGAALGIPWLPQTFLVPVRHGGMDPDDPKADLEWGREPARALLEANPDYVLHHMHDANQDRLMIQRMTYFRVKRTRLGDAYEDFLAECLEPGGTIFLVECGLTWPTVRVADRHVFQHGAAGGASAEEYNRGGPRVADFLRRHGSDRTRWDAPEPDGTSPEAEWGFEGPLRDDVARFARAHGFRVRRILFEQPEAMSPLVADLYRGWYALRRRPARRLLVDSFILMEPWWTLRTGSVPFWMLFNVEPSAEALGRYLDESGPFDEIFLMLFSHGVDSIGLASIDRWRSLLGRARVRGEFVGVDPARYPRDFATFAEYHAQLPTRIAARHPIPGPLSLRQLDAFLAASADRYDVRWADGAG